MKGFVCFLLLLAAIGSWTIYGVGNWFLTRDTQHVLERAQVAAEATDMREYVVTLRMNMVERGMTRGYAALIFKSPENDMRLIFKAVTQIEERLSLLEKLPHNEVTYQAGLDDLRGTLRELSLHTGGWYWVSHWPLVALASLFTLAFCIAGAIVLGE